MVGQWVTGWTSEEKGKRERSSQPKSKTDLSMHKRPASLSDYMACAEIVDVVMAQSLADYACTPSLAAVSHTQKPAPKRPQRPKQTHKSHEPTKKYLQRFQISHGQKSTRVFVHF